MSTLAGAWRLNGRRELTLDRPRVMGILNITPDSFSDGGSYAGVAEAVAAASQMAAQGAEVIDVGGESTRPRAERVGAEEQIRRVVPVIREIRGRLGAGVLLSVDTTLSAVAEAALDAGADAVNDVSAGSEDARMFALVAERGVGIVLMHRRAPPGRDVYSTEYAAPPRYEGGVVASVKRFLAERAARAAEAGIARDSIVIDPGLGFGKSVEQNLELIARTAELAALGYPLLSGASRKSFTAAVGGVPAGAPASERLHATLGLSVAHLHAGARIFRVHDVGPHVQALGAAWAVMMAAQSPGEPRPPGGVI